MKLAILAPRQASSVVEVAVSEANAFLCAVKKPHNRQKDAVGRAVADLMPDPTLGKAKKGDPAGALVYEFDGVKELYRLAYEYDSPTGVLSLVGTHENFRGNLGRTGRGPRGSPGSMSGSKRRTNRPAHKGSPSGQPAGLTRAPPVRSPVARRTCDS